MTLGKWPKLLASLSPVFDWVAPRGADFMVYCQRIDASLIVKYKDQ